MESDTNVGLGMVPHKKACRCLECENERHEAEIKDLKSKLEDYATDRQSFDALLAVKNQRIERLVDWIQQRADAECAYGEMDFEACGHNRKHGICEPCSARRVLAQDVFVSGG